MYKKMGKKSKSKEYLNKALTVFSKLDAKKYIKMVTEEVAMTTPIT